MIAQLGLDQGQTGSQRNKRDHIALAYDSEDVSSHRQSAKSDAMSEQRLAQLESRTGSLESRIDRVEGKLDSVITMLSDIRVELAKKPSSASLWTMVATVVSLSVAIAFGTFVIADYASRDRTWPPSSAGTSQP